MQTEMSPQFHSLTQIGQGDGVYISTYGCQMNENDSERMMSILEMMNFRSVASPDQAALIIINSCSIHRRCGRHLRWLTMRVKAFQRTRRC